ncbi:hypothetical protein GA516_10365 [Lactobacillus pentosus]|uniref:HEPN domain-containing protein n=1 Tax=Lactiplantibacillus pentosus TaxID=1589 RepID=UPI00128B614B|nr:HEPN domain-containing protein [Lactiplantibacillus pentosus]MCT3292340.1 hypothetical protein [Lactiplantibacillus pentosus]MPQ19711.1 hypothetical protein [Lactiplantibacillus pentosus]UXI96983.1 HEPN domain-containing protein [Lactiplantibacillus pentosus]BBM22200.1 hypothetical protein SN13T_2240 [Lactiplantibacillus plantarum]
MPKSMNKFKKISELLNLNITQLRAKQSNPATREKMHISSFARRIRSVYTEETQRNFMAAIQIILPKVSVNSIPVYSDFEIQMKLESVVLDHIANNEPITEQEVRAIVTELRKDMTVMRKFVFPVSGVIYEDDRINYSENAYFISFQKLMNDDAVPYTKMSPTLTRFKDIKFMVLVINQVGANNAITRSKALEHAESVVAMLNEQVLGYKCKIVDFNGIEEAPEDESEVNLFNSFLQISKHESTFSTVLDWGACFMRLSTNVQLVKENFNLILVPGNDMQRRIKSAMQWLGKASVDPVLSRKFLQAMIAIEALLEDKGNGSTIVDQISTAVCFILKENVEDRLTLKKTIKSMYNLRSRIVHDGAEQVTWEEFNLLYTINNQIIQALLTQDELKKITNISDLQEWLETRKFS